MISCSPLNVSLRQGNRTVTLSRRDLFDVRFQLISDEDAATDLPQPFDNNESSSDGKKQHRHASALQFLGAPSDLIPHIYEGGLKTWECSTDLVEYLDSIQDPEGFRSKHILEVSYPLFCRLDCLYWFFTIAWLWNGDSNTLSTLPHFFFSASMQIFSSFRDRDLPSRL